MKENFCRFVDLFSPFENKFLQTQNLFQYLTIMFYVRSEEKCVRGKVDIIVYYILSCCVDIASFYSIQTVLLTHTS